MPLSEEQRAKMIDFHQKGYTSRQISAMMLEKFGLKVSYRTVSRTISRLNATGSVADRNRTGRPVKCTERVGRLVHRMAISARTKSIPTLAEEARYLDPDGLSQTSVRRILRKYGLKRCIAARKPLLTKPQKARRLAWARAHLEWPLGSWARILFTDEKIFKTRSNRQSEFVTRSSSERLHPDCLVRTTKTAPQAHMWGAIGFHGKPPLKLVRGNLNAAAYQRDILSDVDKMGPKFIRPRRGWTFMHDMAPAHRAASTTRFLAEKGINILDWPGNSPDLNPIENVWAYVQRRLPKLLPRNSREFEGWIHEAWKAVPTSYIQKLIRSMPNRVQEVVRKKGDLTHY